MPLSASVLTGLSLVRVSYRMREPRSRTWHAEPRETRLEPSIPHALQAELKRPRVPLDRLVVTHAVVDRLNPHHLLIEVPVDCSDRTVVREDEQVDDPFERGLLLAATPH